MSEKTNEPEGKPEVEKKKGNIPSKPPIALMIWLLIFAAIGFLIVGKFQKIEKQQNLIKLNFFLK